MPLSKRICNKCKANATLNEKGEYTAIAWHCKTCTKGHCRHARSYKIGKQDGHCSDCVIEALDKQAIQKGAA